MWVHRGFVPFFHPPQATVNPSLSSWMPEAAAAWMPRALSILRIRRSDRHICNRVPPELATDHIGDVQPEHVGVWEGPSSAWLLAASDQVWERRSQRSSTSLDGALSSSRGFRREYRSRLVRFFRQARRQRSG